jgi:Type II secretion system protein B
VSYILDALTKAAQQRDRQVPVVQRLLSPAPRARSGWSYASGRVLAALALNAVLLSAVLFWWLRPSPPPALPEPIAAPAAAPAPASPRPLVKLEPLPTTSATVEKPSSPKSDTRSDAAAAPAKPSAPPPAPRVGTPAVQPTPAPATPPVAAARPAPPPESAGLRLEALIYAEAPAERMVFINGRRYREGDSIDGRLRIEEIREEGVELSDQGRRFTLRVSR